MMLSNQSYSHIRLSSAQLDIIIGLLEHERIHPQTVMMDLQLTVDRKDLIRSACQANLEMSINYAEIWYCVQFLGMYAQFQLLESFAYSLSCILLSELLPAEKRAPIYAIQCRLSKPEVLRNCVPQLDWSIDVDELKQCQGYYSTKASVALDRPMVKQILVSLPEVTIARIYQCVADLIEISLQTQQYLLIISGTWYWKDSPSTMLAPYTVIQGPLNLQQILIGDGPIGGLLIERP